MKVYKLPNAAASKITVTSTATSLEDLIATAASADYAMPAEIDAVDLWCEANTLRYFSDGNTPTAALGVPMEAGDMVSLRGLSGRKVQLIRSGASDATVTVQVGVTNPK